MQQSTISDRGIYRADGADGMRKVSADCAVVSFNYRSGTLHCWSVDIRNGTANRGVYDTYRAAPIFHGNSAMDSDTDTSSKAKETEAEAKVTTASNSSNQENRRGD